jgi:DNA-binding transcriptional MerR regulator
MSQDSFPLTTNEVAAAVPCDPGTVRAYCDCGLLEHQRLANGMRLLKRSAIDRVREIRAERLARRGGNHGRHAAA